MIKEITLKDILRVKIKGKKDYIPLPGTVHFNLTDKCNLRCIYCYNDKPSDSELSCQEIFRILDELKMAGTLQLIFVGGEPFMHSDLIKILRYATLKRGFKVYIITNGTLITKQILRGFRELTPPPTITVTLRGSKPEIHDSITKIKASFNQTLNGLKLLLKMGIETAVGVTVVKQIFDDLDNIKSLCDKLGVNSRFNIHLHPTVCGSKRPLDYLLTDFQVRELTSKEYYRQGGDENKLSRPGLCQIGYDEPAIGADGKVYGCNISRIECGDLRKDRFLAIWRSSPVFRRLRAIKREDYPCNKCKYFIYCFSCIGGTCLTKGHIREVSKEFCRITKNNMAIKRLLRDRD